MNFYDKLLAVIRAEFLHHLISWFGEPSGVQLFLEKRFAVLKIQLFLGDFLELGAKPGEHEATSRLEASIQIDGGDEAFKEIC